MLTGTTALSILRRLSMLPKYPFHKEAELEMMRILAECCYNEDHAIAVVQEFTERFPTPSELRLVALNLRDRFDTDRLKCICSLCGGTGWRGMNIKGIDCATRCVCKQPNTRQL
jgi:hypothetical protein